MSTTFRKLYLLVWKNFILQIRRPIGTIVELLIPVFMLGLLLFARVMVKNQEKCLSSSEPQDLRHQTYLEEFKSKLSLDAKILTDNTLAYYPINENTTKILEDVAKTLNVSLATVSYNNLNFTSKQQVINDAEEFEDRYLGAIIFENVVTSEAFPKNVEYSIRLHHSTAKLFNPNLQRDTWSTNFVYPPFRLAGPQKDTFYLSPFISLQYAVDSAVIKFHTKSNSKTAPHNIQHLPYPDYIKDMFIKIIQSTMPTVFILGYIYTAIMILKELVAEKQFRLKESMKMMGLPNWIHWTAWFIKIFLFLLISIILQTILLKAGKVFEFADGGVIFVFLVLYFLAAIFSLFFVSTFFSRSVMAMLCGLLLWFGSLAPYFTFSDAEKFEELSAGNKFASCLLPNTCLGIIVQIISRRESTQTGVNWSNVNKKTSVDDNFTLAQAFGVLIFDCLIYGVLTWYAENVFPGEFGVPRPLYFPFQPSYWCGKRKSPSTGSLEDVGMPNEAHEDRANYEEEPEGLSVGVGIKGLRKVFKAMLNKKYINEATYEKLNHSRFQPSTPSEEEIDIIINNIIKTTNFPVCCINRHFNGAAGTKVAVDGLSLNMYKGQITALLGHNGAGKTTTMSMLTGLFQPTSGSADINGHSIATEMDKIRESLGLCPQHNVLFDRMTVREHLEFFSALKGVDKKTAEAEIDEMLQEIQLADKANQMSSRLSGGMKRKLCCGIALIGGSETVFLDEPTSGMDPYARRATWDLLQRYRGNKTIILTTHFMDEADYLGDRIAIMADGQLRCCGSSLFLKKRYGVGYHMTLVKGPDFQDNKTRSLISRSIPTSKLVGNIGAEMSYILEESSTKCFKGLFETLEERKDEYGISSFGISVTTLEEVFLKVGEGETVRIEKLEEERSEEDTHLHKVDRSESVIEKDQLLTGLALKATQFKAMFIKRLLNSKREKKAVITQVVIPLLLVLCGFLLSLSTNSQKNDESLTLTLAKLKDKSDLLYGFYSDLSNASSKRTMQQIAASMYASESVNMVDIAAECLNIGKQNEGLNISLPYSKSKYTGVITSSKKECCNYKYLVLNNECRSITRADYAKLCGSKPANFGYGRCMDCVDPTRNEERKCTLPKLSMFGTLSPSRTLFQEYILEDSGKGLDDYFDRKVAGFSVEDDGEFTVWYSNQAFHTIPSAFSVGSNILLKYYTNDSSYSIVTNNFPLPRNTREKNKSITNNSSNFTLVTFIAMAASMIAASFVSFLVAEKTSKAKHIQFVSGVDSISYWGAAYCWDFVNYMVPAFVIFLLFAAFNLGDYEGELGAVFLVLVLFGYSVLPFVYLLTFLFTSPLIGYAVVASLLMILSLAMVIAVMICRTIPEEEAAKLLHHIFLLFPTYALPQALSDISANVGYRKACTASQAAMLYCEKENQKYYDSSLEWDLPAVGTHCLYMFVEGCVFFILVLLIEENFFLNVLFATKQSSSFTIREGEDIDVKAEREKVDSLSESDVETTALVVKDLTKIYRSTGMMAVDHLNFSIPKAECFGLLGVNGAGKTTTFGMLTGELGISDGSACVLGYDIQTNLRDVQQRIGYCPQFDAFIEKLTGREMLRMFARLRGIPAHILEEVVTAAVDQMNLGKWADKLCGNYSGGNKRKLSTAMALVGDPQVVFLDEPTSGMDPTSRRFLWNTLTSVVDSGRSIVLTSHSMEECEALCSRLVVMVNGQFKCIGGIQHLKSKYGQGYTVMMKVSGEEGKIQSMPKVNSVENPTFSTSGDGSLALPQQTGGMKPSSSMQNMIENSVAVKDFMSQQFPGAALIEDRQGLLQYQILNPEIRWSQLFGALEENASKLNIVDYSVSQTSLEQVFINFAKHQHSEERVVRRTCCSCTCF